MLARMWTIFRASRDPLCLFFLSVAVHLLPFFLYGKHPLGYDTGFYRRYLIEPLLSFPNSPVPGLGSDAFFSRAILDILRFTHLPPDIILYGSYVLAVAALPVLIYMYLQASLGRRGACIAALFVILSAVSYNAYWYMLWKNALALDLLFIAFILFERHKFFPLFLLDAAVVLAHKTSAVMYILSLGFLFLFSKGKRLGILAHATFAGVIFLFLNIPTVREVSIVSPTAVFLDWQNYLVLSAPFLLLIIFGAKTFKEKALPSTLLAFFLASFIYTLLHLPFFERIFVFLDIAVALMAAHAAEYLLQESEKKTPRLYLWVGILCVALGLLVGTFWNQLAMLRPLLAEKEINEIVQVDSLLPQGAYLLTTSSEAPYYEGWTHAHIIAPGLLHDTHNYERWEAFWNATSSASKISFLNSFPKPLYVSTLLPLTELLGEKPECLTEVAPNLLYNSCE